MANHIVALLEQWYPQKDELDWVLATVTATQGSSYRKSGAMMLINSLGQYFGVVSGGCLESDVMRQARKCWMDGRQRCVVYDMLDEDDLAWKLGIGCGGKVEILLQPLHKDNHYLELDVMLESLSHDQAVFYHQSLNSSYPHNTCSQESSVKFEQNSIYQVEGVDVFVSYHRPRYRLAIFGAGVDAQPLAKLADTLGWRVTLFDERLGYAKSSFFPSSCEIVREAYSLLQPDHLAHVHAAVIMNHSVSLDASALSICNQYKVPFIGLLGPNHRTEKVLLAASLTPDQITSHVSNPVGLALGGELPESIALSIVAEIHAHLHQATSHSLSTFEQLSSCLRNSA